MKNRNLWLTTAAICLLFLCAAMSPARADDSFLQAYSPSLWGNATATPLYFTWDYSGSGYNPVNWLWGNLWQAILNNSIWGPGVESPVYSAPPKFCGGDDGFNYLARE
jgi:hypothetical protein